MVRIRVIQKPSMPEVDGIRLDLFEPGAQYELGDTLAALFLVEGWAEPIDSDDPALLIPLSTFTANTATSPVLNLVRDIYPRSSGVPRALASDRQRAYRGVRRRKAIARAGAAARRKK